MLETFEQLISAVAEGYGMEDVVFLDFRKAFNSVPRGRLLHRMKLYGLDGKTLMWIKEFVQDMNVR